MPIADCGGDRRAIRVRGRCPAGGLLTGLIGESKRERWTEGPEEILGGEELIDAADRWGREDGALVASEQRRYLFRRAPNPTAQIGPAGHSAARRRAIARARLRDLGPREARRLSQQTRDFVASVADTSRVGDPSGRHPR